MHLNTGNQPMTQSISAPAPILTFEEFLSHDDGTDTRYELVDGVLVEMPTESNDNCQIAKYLLFELAKFFPISLLCLKDVELEVSGRRAKVRLPDLVVLSRGSAEALQGQPRNILTRDMPPPALVVEVVSPGSTNRLRDYRYKRTEYAARGIAEYWIVDPEAQQVTVCLWVDGQYEDKVFTRDVCIESTLVPELTLTPQQVFTFAIK
jgi:Uma2 family endonuclease